MVYLRSLHKELPINAPLNLNIKDGQFEQLNSKLVMHKDSCDLDTFSSLIKSFYLFFYGKRSLYIFNI